MSNKPLNSGMAPEVKMDVVNQMGFDRQINIYDEDTDFSVFSLLPSNSSFMRDKMKDVPETYRNMDHYNLRKELNPSPTLNQLRLNFWSEYDKCVDFGKPTRKIIINNVIAGVCSLRVFKEHMKEVEKLAWLLTPVQSYQMGVQDIVETCLYKMRMGIEKLDMESVKDMNTIMKIYDSFDKRINGEYQQKVSVKKEVNYTGVPVLSGDQVKDKLKDLGINNSNVISYVDKE